MLPPYQVVPQWPADSISDYDVLVAIGNLLIENLSPDHQTGGHGAGSGEMNIFIYSRHPQKVFGEVKAVPGGHDCWAGLRAAFRKVKDKPFTPLWPPGLSGFKVS